MNNVIEEISLPAFRDAGVAVFVNLFSRLVFEICNNIAQRRGAVIAPYRNFMR
jgi:hypothetical protein